MTLLPDTEFKPWMPEAEHATSRSRWLPTILSFKKKYFFVSFKPPRPGNEPRTLSVKGSGANHYLNKWSKMFGKVIDLVNGLENNSLFSKVYETYVVCKCI